MLNIAKQLVEKAKAEPQNWFGDEQGDDEVLFSDGIFTVGSNGDYEDFEDAAAAAAALAGSWEKQ